MATPPPDYSLLFALLFDICIAAAALFAAFLIRRTQPGVARFLATGFVILCAAYALYDVQHLGTEMLREATGWYRYKIPKIIIAVVLIVLLLRFPKRLLSAGRTLFLIFSPLFFILTLNGLWTYHVASGDDPGRAAGMLPATASSNRVIWVVFDELDANLVFHARPQRIQMPEFDRLRQESLDATQVTTPAENTAAAVASMFVGKVLRNDNIKPAPPDKLRVQVIGTSKWLDFGSLPNVFRRARAAGFNTAISGWMYPYCRMLGNDLSDCAWMGSGFNLLMVKRGLNGKPFLRKCIYMLEWQARISPFMFYSLSDRPEDPQFARQSSIDTMRFVSQNGLRMLGNQKLNLVFLHYPTPHPPGIWDTRTHTFTTANKNYIDNLQLADDTLGRIRQELEALGEWDSSTVLVSGDHPLRPMWSTFDAGTFDSPEVRSLTEGQHNSYVPFLLKLPFQKDHVEYNRPFNSVISGELVFEMLTGHLRTPADVAKWLDERSGSSSEGKSASP